MKNLTAVAPAAQSVAPTASSSGKRSPLPDGGRPNPDDGPGICCPLWLLLTALARRAASLRLSPREGSLCGQLRAWVILTGRRGSSCPRGKGSLDIETCDLLRLLLLEGSALRPLQRISHQIQKFAGRRNGTRQNMRPLL